MKSSLAIGTTSTAESAAPAACRGRFAPSPSGPLHFGSLVAAIGSFLDARARGGQWLVRLEDLDLPRVRPGAADTILRQLDALGLHWDGPVWRQSERTDAYDDALEELGRKGLLRRCRCSRSTLAALAENRAGPVDGIGDELYHPADCVPALGDGAPDAPGDTLRLRVATGATIFHDRSLGQQSWNVAATTGDFVLRRRDGIAAYQLAVVVDDAAQGITDVVRGCDLLASTPRQIRLQEALGLPRPGYLHLPLAVDGRGRKLSKSADAPAVVDRAPAAQVATVLEFLGQSPPSGLARAPLVEVWNWAREHWRVAPFSGRIEGTIPGEPRADIPT